MTDHILCIHDPDATGPKPCPLCVARKHKRIHPFDVYSMIEASPNIPLVIKRGREKVTIEAGNQVYSYWATVMEIDGVLYTETTTVDPQTIAGMAMMLQFQSTAPKMPKARVTYSHLEVQPPALCGFAMSTSPQGMQPERGAIYCNREKGHSGDHSHTFPIQALANAKINAQVDALDAVRGQYQDRINFSDLAAAADQVDQNWRQRAIIMTLIALLGFSLGVAVAISFLPHLHP